MTLAGWLQIALLVGALAALAGPLGAYLARVADGRRMPLDAVERGLLRVLGVPPPAADGGWRAYARTLLVFSAVCLAALYALLRLQGGLPLDPRGFAGLRWDLALNSSVSFASNTSWQFFGGETTLTGLSQLAGLGTQSFLSAGVGLAVAFAVLRGVTGRPLGSFWRDLVRALVHVVVPLAVAGALVLAAGGVVATGLGVATATDGTAITRGPVAAWASIKTLGSVGGGWFNVNSAHPFEGGAPVATWVQALLIVLVPAGLLSAYGRMAANRRTGRVLLGVCLALLTAASVATALAESSPTPAQAAAGLSGGANLEGKDLRNGAGLTALFATATTAGSSGAVAGAMESLSGSGAAAPLALMLTGEAVLGGIGAGLTSLLLLVVLAGFLGALMVGRSPDLLGRRLEPGDVKVAVLGVLVLPVVVLVGGALAVGTPYGEPSRFAAATPQALTEAVWAYGSQAATNGSAFAGYTGFVQPEPGDAGSTVTAAQVGGTIAMLLGRYLPLLAALALAGRLATRRARRPSVASLRTDTPTFAGLLLGVLVTTTLLTFACVVLLGPLAAGLGAPLE